MNINWVKRGIMGVLLAVAVVAGVGYKAQAEEGYYGISMSPMNQKIILTPGETSTGTFKIANPATNVGNFAYVITVGPFYVDDNYDIYYSNNGDYNQIVDWITLSRTEGELAPNEVEEVKFTINVPEDAPAGGQYAAITVTSKTPEGGTEGGLNINISQAMAHIVYAEIAGSTERHGEVIYTDVPSFLFSGNVSGTAAIKNTGNVHSTATYTLEVTPIFSNEEIYTNLEDPQTKTILPDRTLVNTVSWTETPSMGIYNVVFTTEFEGVTQQVKKLVIVCPLYLLFIIIFAIVLAVFWVVSRSKKRNKTAE